MLDLIIKNGLCYIDSNLKKQDIGKKNNKITIIGTLNSENSKEVFDAINQQFYQDVLIRRFILENQDLQMLKI